MMFMAHTEEDDPLMPDDVTITAPKPNPFPDHPGGLPTDPMTPPPYIPDHNDGGNTGGGGGGSSSNPPANVPQIQQKDCSGQAGENTAGAQAIYGTFNQAGLQEFIDSKIGSSNEWGVALNYDSRTGNIQRGESQRAIGDIYKFPRWLPKRNIV